MQTVAALFVDEHGPYCDRPDIDAWPERRDARLYAGTLPVVAHPPCQLWTNLACLNFKRWGGEHNRPGNDGGCFESALSSVAQFYGVLEHPKNSRAFREYNIPHPSGSGWQRFAKDWYVCEVWQSAYGHRAAKATWLCYRGKPPAELDWTKPKGSHQIGRFDVIKPVLSSTEAARTPPLFAETLLALARGAR